MTRPMYRVSNFTIELVEYMPSTLEQGVLYVSMRYATVIHLCACGCGEKVVTPLSPSDWSLAFDGETISLSPSIGNWDFPCRSHYWIKRSQAIYAESWGDGKNQQKTGGKSKRKTKKYSEKSKHETVKKSPKVSKKWKWLTGFLFF